VLRPSLMGYAALKDGVNGAIALLRR